MFWWGFGAGVLVCIFIGAIIGTIWVFVESRYDRSALRFYGETGNQPAPPKWRAGDPEYQVKVIVTHRANRDNQASVALDIPEGRLDNMPVQPGISKEETIASVMAVGLEMRLVDLTDRYDEPDDHL